MGLFTRNFDKPGPGVSPDAPRKKGAARFFEILGRDFSTIWLAGILAMLGGLPFAAGVWFAVETHSLVPLVIAGVLGGMIAAPQIVGLTHGADPPRLQQHRAVQTRGLGPIEEGIAGKGQNLPQK